MGHKVWVCYTKEQVDEYIEFCIGRHEWGGQYNNPAAFEAPVFLEQAKERVVAKTHRQA